MTHVDNSARLQTITTDNGRIYDLNDDMDIEIPLGKIINGLKEGFWTDWYKNGSIKSKINWRNGQISDIGYNY